MAQTDIEIRFISGTKAQYSAAAESYANDIFFATDTKEIIAGGTAYGLSSEAAADLSALENAFTGADISGANLVLTRKSGAKVNVPLLSTSTPKAAGTAAAGSAETAARADHVHPLQTSVSGNAGTATKLQTPRTIDGVNFDGSASVHHFATCSTAAGTAAKAASLTGFTLTTGARVTVKFQNTNTASSPTLNVNSTGAKAIQYNGAAIPASYLKAGRTYELVYDGTAWQMVGDVDTDTTYSAATTSAAGLMSASDKKKLDGIAAGANKTTVDSALSSTSTNPVQNKAVKAALDQKVPIGSDGKIASSYLPSYVDDVLEYTARASFPSTGETGKIYVDTSTNLTYRWSGSAYVEISKSLALGTTASTAFPGDRGLQAEKDIDTVTATANANKSNISSLTTRVSAAENDITALKQRLCWYEAD